MYSTTKIEIPYDQRYDITNIKQIPHELIHFETNYIMEYTPYGNVVMKYDNKTLEFQYYCDKSIPNNTLNTVARKYVKTFQCPDIYMPEVKQKDVIKIVGDKEEITNLTKDKNVFAKFKTYNKSTRAKTEDIIKNMIIKANNKFKNKGKVAEFMLLQKELYKPALKQRKIKSITFSDYMKMKNSME
jgi:hypothetical protein